MKILPLWFAIPESKIVTEIPVKTHVLSSLVPFYQATYEFKFEEHYRDQYKKAVFAITHQKSGWDCMRHYEILACGTIPLFTSLHLCPPAIMQMFPKDLVIDANNALLPYINKDSIDLLAERARPWNEKILAHTRNYCTTNALATYLLNIVLKPDVDIENVSILFIYNKWTEDYQDVMLLHGLKDLLGPACEEYPRQDYLYKDFPLEKAHMMYGRGMHYTRDLDVSYKSSSNLEEIKEKIKNHEYTFIMYGDVHSEKNLWKYVSASYAPEEIIMICGADSHMCDGVSYAKKGHYLFVREADERMLIRANEIQEEEDYERPLELIYHQKCGKMSDIFEHMPTLYELAKQCTHITELGVRAAVSSYAFGYGLVGRPDTKLVMVDLEDSQGIQTFLQKAKKQGLNAVFYQQNDLECVQEETDLVFIDTWHVYGQLKRELARWHSVTRKWIVLHDTTVDADEGETVRGKTSDEEIDEMSQKTHIPREEIMKGLWPAVEEFLAEHPEWKLQKRYTNNNGLTILCRQ
jgi:hypothetical protein